MTDHYSEQVFDYFLEELVSEQPPPDLSAQIELRWRREQENSGSHTRMRPSTVNPSLVVAELVDQPVCNVASFAAPSHRRSSTFSPRNLIAVALAVAACGMFIALSSRLALLDVNDTKLVVEAADPGKQLDGQAVASAPHVAPAKASRKPQQTSEALPLDNIPFALDSATVSHSLPNKLIPGSITQLDSQQITLQIDQSLTMIWRELGLTPAPALAATERAQQVARLINGSQASSFSPSTDLNSLVVEATQSLAFARLWSDRFVNVWFARSSLALDDSRLQDLRKETAALIRDELPWNTVPLELLGGDVSSPAAAGENATTSAFVSALSGNGNHRLVARIGNSFLDANLACARCHDSNLVTSDKTAVLNFDKQNVYWSLVALLQGLDARSDENGKRVALDRQAQQLASGKRLTTYFDLLDGRLQAAEPQLPDGQAWEAIESAQLPRIALAKWLSESEAFDAATVNQVWKVIFGQELAPQVFASSNNAAFNIAVEKRRELQLFLARQFRAHGHDLKALVGWIALSQAAGLSRQEINQGDWLNAADSELSRWQLSDLMFAAGPTNSPTKKDSLEDLLAAVMKWRGSAIGESAAATTLAQPLPNAPVSPKRRQQAIQATSQSSMPSQSFVLHGELHSPDELSFVDRLLKSNRLSWDQCVEHVVLLNPDNTANARIKHLADELLRQHSGDARSALLDLLWAVKSSDII